MSPIVALLLKMRGRVAMYLGQQSLVRLAAFLRGYDLAINDRRAQDCFLSDFRDWVHQRYGASNRSWEDTISSACKDQEEALQVFWSLFDEFLKVSQNGTSGEPPNAPVQIR